MYKCEHCKQLLSGDEVIIEHMFDDQHGEVYYLLHKKCRLVFIASLKGLSYKCPKCNGQGEKLIDELCLFTQTINNNTNLHIVSMRQVYDKPNIYNSGKLEPFKKIIESCKLCDGDGYLEKEPVPIITDWKRR